MSRTGVFTDKAPTLRPGVYSHAIVANGFVFTSGVLGADPVTKKIIEGTVIDRFHQVMRNLDAVLTEGGSSLNDVVEVSVFLTSIEDANDLTPEYIKYFGEPKPARTAVAVKQLPYDSDIEIKCVAVQSRR
ncbi:hypothetical protein PRZ48_005111 [Zasmidium cellare]|uniref:Uncharacterized protein n=1 Tax=Zasmidium cellare TaxID=395010 RepID=A0ABR0ESU2_ZASCE|nr:hypothetical protein PRZ48_005111 [Zasmidium cellare]